MKTYFCKRTGIIEKVGRKYIYINKGVKLKVSDNAIDALETMKTLKPGDKVNMYMDAFGEQIVKIEII